MKLPGIAFVFALVTAAAAPVGAETPERGEVVGGAMGGGNLNTLSGDARDYTLNLGVALGAWVDIDLGNGVGVRPELMLTDKGGDYEELDGRDLDESFLYAELPVLARYELPVAGWLSVRGFLGPQISWLLDSKQIGEDDLNRLDIGAVVGVGTNFYVSDDIITVDVRLDWGFLDAVADDDLEARNRTVALTAGVTM